jgi:hypothetical protein
MTGALGPMPTLRRSSSRSLNRGGWCNLPIESSISQ